MNRENKVSLFAKRGFRYGRERALQKLRQRLPPSSSRVRAEVARSSDLFRRKVVSVSNERRRSFVNIQCTPEQIASIKKLVASVLLLGQIEVKPVRCCFFNYVIQLFIKKSVKLSSRNAVAQSFFDFESLKLLLKYNCLSVA